jgi:hypothetical protein
MKCFNTTLVKDKKRIFIPYNFQIGYYSVRDTKHAKQDGQIQLEYRFRTGSFRRHDTKGLVLKHVEQVSIIGPMHMRSGRKRSSGKMHNIGKRWRKEIPTQM